MRAGRSTEHQTRIDHQGGKEKHTDIRGNLKNSSGRHPNETRGNLKNSSGRHPNESQKASLAVSTLTRYVALCIHDKYDNVQPPPHL